MRPRLAFAIAIPSAFALIVALTPMTAHAAPGGNRSPRSALADLNGNRVSDDFESQLAKASPGTRFRVVVRFTSSGSEASAKQAVGAFDVRRRFTLIRGIAATMTTLQIRALALHAGVFRIEKDFTVKATMDAARRDFGVDAAQADFSATGAGIEICVVDTGVNPSHEQLDNGKVVAFADFIGPNQNVPAYDDHYHGTHVASIAAGDGVGGPNAAKYRGVAPGASISAAKVLNSQGSGPDSGVIAGVQWCANRPSVRVISMSLGNPEGSDGTDSLSQAVNNAVSVQGKVVVVAAGNSGDIDHSVGSPGAAANAITVGAVAEYSAPTGATNHSDGVYLAFFSSRGPTLDGRTKPDVVSPGLSITAADSLSTPSGYRTLSGTSMATPFVAGVVALGLQKNPALSATTVKPMIQSTAQDWGASGKDDEWGSGLVDAYAFVAQAAGGSGNTTFPTHTRLDATVGNNGLWTYTFSLAAGDLTTPIGVTVTVNGQASCVLPVGNDCWLYGDWTPDLDAELRDPSNTAIDRSICSAGDPTFDPNTEECALGHQETLHAMPTTAGTYTILVWPYGGDPNFGQGGTFGVDLSRGPAGGGGPPPPPPNTPPTANAGTDQTVQDTDANGTESASLNGSLSSDTDGTIDSYIWRENGSQIATGANPTVNLGIGTHTITLTVTDDGGATGSDQVVVAVTRASPSVHVGDIDATRKVASSSWKATATITVHLANEALAQSGTVSGTWNGGPTVTCALTSRSKGKCSITKSGIPISQASITFTVTGISAGVLYAPAYNHDPDGSSNGTSIVVVK